MKFGNDLIRHGAIVLAGTLGSNFFFYVFHFGMSRLLGVSGYGSMLGLFSVIVVVGIPALVAQTVVAKTVAGFRDHARIDRIRGFARRVVACAAGIAMAVAAILCITRSALMHFLNASDSAGVLIVAWAVLFYLVVPILNGILQGEQRFRGLAISLVSDAVTRAVLAIVFVVRGYGVNGALLAIAIGATVGTVVSAIFVADLLRAPERAVAPAVEPQSLGPALRVSAGILVISILASVDVMLVKHFRTAYEAGLFGAIALVGRIVYLIASFVPTIVLPKAAARINAGQSPVPLLIQSVVVFLVALSTVVIPLLAAPALVLRTIAGNAYVSAAPLLALYGCAIAFLAAAYAAANYKIGVNRLGFVYPVVAIGCAEVAVISVRHDSLFAIVEVLAIGHFLIFIAATFRIWVHAEHRPPVAGGFSAVARAPDA